MKVSLPSWLAKLWLKFLSVKQNDSNQGDLPSTILSTAGIKTWFLERDIVRQTLFEVKLKRDLSIIRRARAKAIGEIDTIQEKWDEQEDTLLDEGASPEAIYQLRNIRDHEISTIEGSVSQAESEMWSELTRFLLSEADRYLLPTPSKFDTDFWRAGQSTVLSNKGIASLRSAIRKEQKERSDIWQARIALTIGLVGTLIGLVSSVTALVLARH